MKFLPSLTLVSLLGSTSVFASAQPPGPFGLGLVLAGPTGLSAQYYYQSKRSIGAQLAWGSRYLHFNLDHLWTHKDLAVVDGIGIDVYTGVGLRLESRDRDDNEDERATGIRFPLGLSYHFQKVPLQVFAELSPALILVDSSELAVDIALGGRYFF